MTARLPFSLVPPPAWAAHPFGRVVDRSLKAGEPDARLLSVFLDEGVVPRDSRNDNFNRLGADLAKYLVVREGDLVFNKLRTWQGGLGVSRFHGIVSPAYFVCRPHPGIEPRFLHYLLRSRIYLEELTRISKWMPPSQFDISWDDLRGLGVLVPPLTFQRRIADSLDRETGWTEALIAERRRMAGLVAERWAADLATLMYPDWVPDHILAGADRPTDPAWAVEKLLWLTDRRVPIAYGILLPGERLEDGVPYLGAGDVRPDRMRREALPRTSPAIAAAYPRTTLKTGDLVYAIRGSFGAVEQVPPQLDGVNLSRDVARIAPRPDVNSRWLMYALKTEVAQEQFRRREVGATVTGVNIEDLKNVMIPVPSPAAQERLAQELDDRRAGYDALEDVLSEQIALLREHRQALVSAAVTGQRGIPEAA